MPASRQRFYLVVPDLTQARGKIESLSFTGSTAESFAAQLQAALREPALWQRWRALQPDPDALDPALGVCDRQANVNAQESDMQCNVQVTTSLPHAVLKQRLGFLIGAHWTLRDVTAA